MNLEMEWAEKSWTDPDTGTRVVRISPDKKAHFRNNYFRHNMFTADGRWAVFIEFEDLADGQPRGLGRVWARDLLTGELRELVEIPVPSAPLMQFAVAPRSHLVNVIDVSQAGEPAVLQIDIDSGARRRVEPSVALGRIYQATFSADERWVYTMWQKEKGHLQDSMSFTDWRAMMSARPGYQEMVRIDLATGRVETVFSATSWCIGHPNPHPSDPDLLMCCQELAGERPDSKWGAAAEHERIRVMDLRTKSWLDTRRTGPVLCGHEHWARRGRRIYAHTRAVGRHAINRIDLDAGENLLFPCPVDLGWSAHVTVAPDESFLVGDGANFDRHTLPPEIRRVFERELARRDDYDVLWFRGDLERSNGGETIWKYELPEESSWDYDLWERDREKLEARIAAHPEMSVRTTPVCRFRTLARGPMMCHRLESNAHVTPDSRWAVFQSSSEDDWFEVWAARVPAAE